MPTRARIMTTQANALHQRAGRLGLKERFDRLIRLDYGKITQDGADAPAPAVEICELP